MSLLISPAGKPDFFSLSPDALDSLVARWGWPRFRADQLRDWVYRKLVLDPQRMTNLSARDRALLVESIAFGSAQTLSHQSSSDGTQKLLLGWPTNSSPADPIAAEPSASPAAEPTAATPIVTPITSSAETVMIPDGPRRTACVSSQVGCPVGCKFCASGIGGAKGNLSAGQIVEQVIALNRLPSGAVTHIVFMGMGEPLANYANVISAVRILHDPKCLNIGARKITISTVGVPAKMRQLAHEDLPLNLAISLHAPDEALRRQLIPWAEHFAMNDILDAARYYFDKTGREVTLEYILLSGVNDRPEQARQLAQICRTLRANVNLIRYNEVESLPYRRPASEDVMNFQSILRHNGVNAHVRKSRGRDIDAACGQLRRKEQGDALVQVGVAR